MNYRTSGRFRITPISPAGDPPLQSRRRRLSYLLLAVPIALSGCRNAREYRASADEVAQEIITEAQKEALGKTEPINIETPADTLRRRLLLDQNLPVAGEPSLGVSALKPLEHWPESEDYLRKEAPPLPPVPDKIVLTLTDALKIGAANSREFQTQKEQVFRTALDLDLESDEFRSTFSGVVSGEAQANLNAIEDANGEQDDQYGLIGTATTGVSKRFKNGAAITSRIGIDLVKLLTQSDESSRGLFADASITIPLLRGAGREIVTEPLTQAERNVIYAINDFEDYKREFAVRVADSYLSVLQQQDEVRNAEENYKGLISAARRARRLADAGRLPEIQVDQALQDQLRARERWIRAQQSYASRLDTFKILIGLPTDANVELEYEALETLTASVRSLAQMQEDEDKAAISKQGPVAADAPVTLIEPDRLYIGPYEMTEKEAVDLALENRPDLRNALGRVYDAQRKVYVAADLLQADLTLNGDGGIGQRRASLGSADSPNSNLYLDEARLSSSLILDLPLERTAERNIYRQSFINLERSVRDVQALEDQIKLEVRTNLRNLLEYRESLRIQNLSLELAQRRVDSTNLFLQAGRAEIRDLLDAQEALISAQNALTSALVNYRIAELELQRDLGILEVSQEGLWKEYLEEANGSDKS
jgi:outer membrane protein TolC